MTNPAVLSGSIPSITSATSSGATYSSFGPQSISFSQYLPASTREKIRFRPNTTGVATAFAMCRGPESITRAAEHFPMKAASARMFNVPDSSLHGARQSAIASSRTARSFAAPMSTISTGARSLTISSARRKCSRGQAPGCLVVMLHAITRLPLSRARSFHAESACCRSDDDGKILGTSGHVGGVPVTDETMFWKYAGYGDGEGGIDGVIDKTGEPLERETDPVPYSEGHGEQGVGIVAKDVAANDHVVFRVAQLPEVVSADTPAILA